MFWANDIDTGKRIQAEPGVIGVCPICDDPVFSKTGNLRVWHFSHHKRFKSQVDCDPWAERESEWHLSWKSRVPDHMREYVVKRQRILPNGLIEQSVHRADILNSRGTVIELQHSRISPEEIFERETFYENMIWIFDAQQFTFTHPEKADNGIRYIWKNRRSYIPFCKKPVFFHLGGKKIFNVEYMNLGKPPYISGKYVSFDNFLEIFFI